VEEIDVSAVTSSSLWGRPLRFKFPSTGCHAPGSGEISRLNRLVDRDLITCSWKYRNRDPRNLLTCGDGSASPFDKAATVEIIRPFRHFLKLKSRMLLLLIVEAWCLDTGTNLRLRRPNIKIPEKYLVYTTIVSFQIFSNHISPVILPSTLGRVPVHTGTVLR
jgi:hypothetical protein